MRLARASVRSGVPEDRSRAAEMFARVYYEFPFSEVALDARSELDRLRALEPLAPQNARYRLDLGRAERFFASRRCADAQSTLRRSSRMQRDDRISSHPGPRRFLSKTIPFRPRGGNDCLTPASRGGGAVLFYGHLASLV